MKLGLVASLAAALWGVPAPAYCQAGAAQGFVAVQPEGQWLVSRLIGHAVVDESGERIGDVNDLLLDESGHIASVVMGVGGFLGIGEKSVAVPFAALSLAIGADGRRVVRVGLSQQQLKAAPEFKPTGKIVYMRAKDAAPEAPARK